MRIVQHDQAAKTANAVLKIFDTDAIAVPGSLIEELALGLGMLRALSEGDLLLAVPDPGASAEPGKDEEPAA